MSPLCGDGCGLPLGVQFIVGVSVSYDLTWFSLVLSSVVPSHQADICLVFNDNHMLLSE